jgi:hypothetical protein
MVARTSAKMPAIVKEPNIREETAAIILRAALFMFAVMSFHLLFGTMGRKNLFLPTASLN